MEQEYPESKSGERKPYEKPAVKHELALEIRAGSGVEGFDPLNPLGLGK